MHPGAGLEQIDGNKPDDKGDRGQHFKIDQRLQGDAADFRHVGHAGDAVHDGAEDDRRNEHADCLDKGIAKRLHAGADFWVTHAKRHADRHRHQHQKPKLQIEWSGAHARGRIF